MSRRDPDPRFAAAARTELLRRAGGMRGPRAVRSGRGRPLVVELVLSAGVAIVAAALLVVGGTTHRDVRDAAGPAVSSGPSASATPTGAPVPTAGTTPGDGLVGPSGARIRSDAEIRRFAASQGFTAVWAEQAVLDTTCMAQHGFVWDPILNATDRRAVGARGMTAAQEAAYAAAEDGPPSSGPYDWRTAGCHGRSVHVTGQDAAH